MLAVGDNRKSLKKRLLGNRRPTGVEAFKALYSTDGLPTMTLMAICHSIADSRENFGEILASPRRRRRRRGGGTGAPLRRTGFPSFQLGFQ